MKMKHNHKGDNMKIKKAFTMAEAILVMTILGIIATIMITTLKPAQFKEDALRTLGRKVMSEIDTAMSQVAINDSQDGKMSSLLVDETSGNTFSFASTTAAHATRLEKILKKYLTTTRTAVSATSFCGATVSSTTFSFALKDGACLGVKMGASAYTSQFPGETGSTAITATSKDEDGQTLLGSLYIDTNGDDEPNVFGKDRFAFPVAVSGIYYETPNAGS